MQIQTMRMAPLYPYVYNGLCGVNIWGKGIFICGACWTKYIILWAGRSSYLSIHTKNTSPSKERSLLEKGKLAVVGRWEFLGVTVFIWMVFRSLTGFPIKILGCVCWQESISWGSVL